MPIMAPLGSFAGIPEHLIVTAYTSASGLVALVTPTFAVVTGGLGDGPYQLCGLVEICGGIGSTAGIAGYGCAFHWCSCRCIIFHIHEEIQNSV